MGMCCARQQQTTSADSIVVSHSRLQSLKFHVARGYGRSPQGERLAVSVDFPRDPPVGLRALPYVVAFHGFDAGGDSPMGRELREWTTSHGCLLVRYNARGTRDGLGTSTGKRAQHLTYQVGGDAVAVLRGACREAAAQSGIPVSETRAAGVASSFGNYSLLAAVRKGWRPAALVLKCPILSIDEAAAGAIAQGVGEHQPDGGFRLGRDVFTAPTIRALRDIDARRELAELNIPTLLVYATGDVFAAAERTKRVLGAARHVELCSVEGPHAVAGLGGRQVKDRIHQFLASHVEGKRAPGQLDRLE